MAIRKVIQILFLVNIFGVLGAMALEQCPSPNELDQMGFEISYKGLQADFDLFDNYFDVFTKMSRGNPGALRVLVEIAQHSDHIDPDNILGGFSYILNLDSHGIYAEEIWMLYKDVCKEDLVYFLAVLRSIQLGLIDKVSVYYAMENRGSCLDLEQILNNVQKELPRFGKPLSQQEDVSAPEEKEEVEEDTFIEEALEYLKSYII